ncbi:MAG: hypothetical protein PWP65_2153 [Clostridia bacterium]|nr:hypothetical protein [Clostridia bacterium]
MTRAKTAEALMEEGREFLKQGNFRAAEKSFARSLKLEENMPARNNLALAVFMAGEPQRALQILEPYVDLENKHPEANPFTYALASKINCALDDKDRARRLLQEAITCFDKGLVEIRRSGQSDQLLAFREYTVVIMDAAAGLGDHRLVFDLYRRWEPYHVSWQNRYLAAVACFNLGRYKRAASLWNSIAGEHPLFAAMQQVAFLIERGAIPGFTMGYELYSTEKLQDMINKAVEDEEMRRRLAEDGFLRITMLSYALEAEAAGQYAGAAHAVHTLVTYGGKWGEELGRSILESTSFSDRLKTAALAALTDRGVFQEGDSVPIVIDGTRRLLKLKKIPVIAEEDPELDRIVEQALKLKEEGRSGEAIGLLENLLHEGKLYPRALMALANLLRFEGRLDESQEIMGMLEEINPESPVLLFNFAALMLQKGDLEKARAYLDRIDAGETSEEFKEKLKELRQSIEMAEMAEEIKAAFDGNFLVRYFEEKRRREIEAKPLPVDVGLGRGLKNMPANWLEGTCRIYGLEPKRRRKEREEEIKDFLLDNRNLEKVVRELGEEERKILKYLLSRGGWSRLREITRRYGSMEGDGFYWNEREPQSPLGALWCRALVMVGRAEVNGRRWKIAAVPLELREGLRKILDT